MEYFVNFLFSSFGTHEKAAESLGYSDRHYRKIRKKIARGEMIPARIENLLRAKARELQLAGAEHVCR
jgi:hypothetical protein